MTPTEAMKILGIGKQSMYNYRQQGKLKFTKVNRRKIMYDADSVYNLVGELHEDRETVTYGRVSQRDKKGDLERQNERLYDYCFSNGLGIAKQYQDIRSGMSFTDRPDFVQLLNRVVEGKVKTVVVENKDRLCRFGFELLELLFLKYGASIKVVSNEDNKTYEQELTEDLLSIIHHFSMKSYSHRRRLNKMKQTLTETTE
jgi:predicted site-specific integrase-resolvase